PFIETYTSEKLPWATTPAVHSFEKFPAFEEFEWIGKAYAETANA
ncbi:MAG: aldehyde-activating protein, partial [Salaquimonas sp.]|nr:aldehyde-activating protein [Salaquimonas sp.]